MRFPQRDRSMVTAAVLLLIFAISLDSRVADTAMPTIAGHFGALEQISWAFAAFLITSATTVPLFGRLSDMYGRKLLVLMGIAFFLAGTMLAGQARSMFQLIVFRGVQGIGAGALKPLTLTILADIFPLRERARLQFLVSGAFGSGLVVAPLLAGHLIIHTGWRWTFYLTLLPGLLAALLVLRHMREQWRWEGTGPVDYSGTALLTAATVIGLSGLMYTGKQEGGADPLIVGLLSGSGLLLVGFVAVERRAAHPLLPLAIFRNRTIAAASIGGFLTGITIWSTTSFIPLYAQGVLGVSVIGAGASVSPLVLTWVTSSSIGGFLLLKLGYRATAAFGLAISMAGGYFVTQLGAHAPYEQMILAVGMVGVGGMALTVYLLALQNAVGVRQRGMVTAVSEFTRGLGGAVGVALTGSVLNGQLGRQATRLAAIADPEGRAAFPRALLDPAVRADLPEPALETLRLALAGALAVAFIVPLAAAGLALVSSLWLPTGLTSDRVVPVEEHAL